MGVHESPRLDLTEKQRGYHKDTTLVITTLLPHYVVV